MLFRSAIPYAVTVVAMIVWGGHSDRTGERIWHLALASLFAGLGFVLSAAASSQIVVLLGLGMAAIGVCAALAPFWAIPPHFLTGTGAAAGIALINAVGNLGGVFGPYAVGWALQETGGYAGGMAVLAASLFVAVAMVLAMGRSRRFALALP